MLYTQLHVHDKGVGSVLYECIRSLDHCDSYNANLDQVLSTLITYIQQRPEEDCGMSSSSLGKLQKYI